LPEGLQSLPPLADLTEDGSVHVRHVVEVALTEGATLVNGEKKAECGQLEGRRIG
jgi:hypothetical protein